MKHPIYGEVDSESPKRYLLFMHPELYPRGGLWDSVAFYDLSEAKEYGRSRQEGASVWLALYILDTKEMMVIFQKLKDKWFTTPYYNYPKEIQDEKLIYRDYGHKEE